MKRHRGLPGACSTDLDLSPTDAADTESEHFRDGLLRSPPTGEMQDVRAAVHLLPLRIHAIQESAGVLLENVSDARCFNDVDPDLRTHERNPQSAARRVARRAVRLRDARVPRTRFAIAAAIADWERVRERGRAAPRDRTRRVPAARVTRPLPPWQGSAGERHHCRA